MGPNLNKQASRRFGGGIFVLLWLLFFCAVRNHRQVFEIVRHFRHMVCDSTLPSPGTYPPSSQRGGIRLWVSSAMQHVPSPWATPACRLERVCVSETEAMWKDRKAPQVPPRYPSNMVRSIYMLFVLVWLRAAPCLAHGVVTACITSHQLYTEPTKATPRRRQNHRERRYRVTVCSEGAEERSCNIRSVHSQTGPKLSAGALKRHL